MEKEQHDQQDRVMMLLSVVDETKDGQPITVDDTVSLSLDHIHPIEVRQVLQSQGFKSFEVSYNVDRLVDRSKYEEGWIAKSREMKISSEKMQLLTSVSSISACGITTNLIASHILNAASVCLAIRNDLIVWIKYPYLKLKSHKDAVFWNSAKLWYDGSVKRRSYSGILIGEKHFGLSPAMQQAEITNMDAFAKYGLEWKVTSKDNELDTEEETPYLQMNFKKIINNPVKDNLERLLNDDCVAPKDIVARMLGYLYGKEALERFPDAFKEETVEDGLESIINDPNYKPLHYHHPAIIETNEENI